MTMLSTAAPAPGLALAPPPRAHEATPRSVTMDRDKMGRPPKNPEDRASARIQLVCTDEERKLIEKAAVKANKKLSRWIIDQALRAANSTSPQKRR